MKRLPLLLVLLALSACAGWTGTPAPGCHGARHPANPHGSLLAPDAPAPAPPSNAAPAAGCLGTPR